MYYIQGLRVAGGKRRLLRSRKNITETNWMEVALAGATGDMKMPRALPVYHGERQQRLW